MTNNTISVTVNLINGTAADVLENVSPKVAINQYFYPDSGAPVTFLTIKAKTNDGKTVTLSLSETNISATIE
jgi:hypothetical protein